AIVAKPSRIGLLGNPDNPAYSPVRNGAQDAAKKAGLSLVTVEARSPREIEDAFAAFAKEHVQAVMVTTDAVFLGQQQQLAKLPLTTGRRMIFSQGKSGGAGGRMGNGETLSDFSRRPASFVDKIIRGEKPGDLPIEQPTKFNLVINRKTADALGVTIPAQLYILPTRLSNKHGFAAVHLVPNGTKPTYRDVLLFVSRVTLQQAQRR